MKTTKSTTPAVYVGLDVHKSSILVAYALSDGSDPAVYGKLGGSNLALERGLLKLRQKRATFIWKPSNKSSNARLSG
ncbi:MAG: hypothetical protein KDN19_22935 [Verrucomicrobiae bacterium]|nr:hypothetical protein [Verrucomicrobiae bacterium]MCP5538973.1 hypothetical protein [Akkermansiaceae bacterium]MCP5550637.1 hypothetical protein [Akkermansiaceae bacterium]